MENLRTRIAFTVALALAVFLLGLPNAAADKITVGGRNGWSPNVNFTEWAANQAFYNGDWLFFVYDRNQHNVLEVNKTDYESCNSGNFLHNWTTGAGRDVVPLNQTRPYYFISGKGFCFSGMKLALKVENPPPPPKASPVKNSCPGLRLRGQALVPALLAIAAVWDSFLLRL